MVNVKLAVIYYSMGGTNYQLSKWAAEGGREAGAEVKILKVPVYLDVYDQLGYRGITYKSKIERNSTWKAHFEAAKNVPEVTLNDLEWADAIIFSVPTRYGNMPSQLKQFFDTTSGLWVNGKLVNKVVSAMSSAENPHGGQEATILSLYTTMHHWGAIVVTPGYTDPVLFEAGGNPYGLSVTVDENGKMIEDVQAAVKHQAKRTVTVAEWVKKANQQ